MVTIVLWVWSLGGRSGFERERGIWEPAAAAVRFDGMVGERGCWGQTLNHREGATALREKKIQGQAAGSRRVKS